MKYFIKKYNKNLNSVQWSPPVKYRSSPENRSRVPSRPSALYDSLEHHENTLELTKATWMKRNKINESKKPKQNKTPWELLRKQMFGWWWLWEQETLVGSWRRRAEECGNKLTHAVPVTVDSAWAGEEGLPRGSGFHTWLWGWGWFTPGKGG